MVRNSMKTYKKRESLRKKREKSRKKRTNVQIQTKGLLKTITLNNSVKHENNLEWNSDYNGEKAKVNVFMNQNGKKEKYHIEMNNQEIEKLLSMPSVNTSLDKRLIEDFSLKDRSFL